MKNMIKKFINPAWKNPKLSNMWSVTSISNHAMFMDFVFDNIEYGEKWYIEMVFRESTKKQLNTLSMEGRPITLTTENISTIKNMLPDFDFKEDFVHHRICDDQQCLFVAYDNMSQCWLSKRINKEKMAEASKKLKFQFSENA